MPLTVTKFQTDTAVFGFDSAWTDRSPGAICTLAFDAEGNTTFDAPRVVRFLDALDYIASRKQSHACTVVALDQPTIVPNETGMRPAERAAASLLSFTGGGVQPANRSKKSMFGADAPIWGFKKTLGADDDPFQARLSSKGTYLIEVFPALALSGLVDRFAGRLCAPKYNPRNKRFRQHDWIGVVQNVAAIANTLGLTALSNWCSNLPVSRKPTKAEQDCLDAAICVLVGFIWRACARDASALLGDMEGGYVVAPVSLATGERLREAAESRGVPFAWGCGCPVRR